MRADGADASVVTRRRVRAVCPHRPADSAGGHPPVTRVRYRAAMTLTDRTAPRPAAYAAPDPDRVGRVAGALLDAALEPIVDMVVTADDDAYEARTVDGRVRFRRQAERRRRRGWGGVALRRRRGRGPQPARRHRHRPVPAARRRAGPPLARPHAAGLPARLRADRPALRPPGRPRPRVPAQRRPTTGRTTAASGASTARSAWCRCGRRSSSPAPGCARTASCPGPRRLVDVAPTVLALLGAEPCAGGGRARPAPPGPTPCCPARTAGC